MADFRVENPASSGGLTIGTTAITSGTDKRVLFDDNGVVGEDAELTYNKTTDTLTLSHAVIEGVTTTGATGTGKLVFDGTPTLVTPVIGAATGTSLALSGAIGQVGGTTGASISAASGVLTLAGIGNTNNENLLLDLEGTANACVITSGTGLTKISFGGAVLNSPSSTTANFNSNISTSVSGIVLSFNSSTTNTSAQATNGANGASFTGIRSGTTGGNAQTIIGCKGTGSYSSTGTQIDAIGVYGIVTKITSASGVISDAYSVYGDLPTASGGGSITRSWALYGNGNLGTVGTYAKYNNITTVSNGVPSEYATSDLTTQSAAIAATTLYAVPSTGAGMYRVSWVATITTAASTSSSLGGTNGFQLKYTDNDDSVVKTMAAGNSITSAANTTGTAICGVEVGYCKASTNLQYLFDYTSVGVTAMVYNLHIKVEAL